MTVTDPDAPNNPLEYETRPLFSKPGLGACLKVGISVFVCHLVIGVVWWPLKFVIDHQWPVWVSVATDWVFPFLLPLPFAGLQFGMNQNASGGEEIRMLLGLTLLNSVLYGEFAALAYHCRTRRVRR